MLLMHCSKDYRIHIFHSPLVDRVCDPPPMWDVSTWHFRHSFEISVSQTALNSGGKCHWPAIGQFVRFRRLMSVSAFCCIVAAAASSVSASSAETFTHSPIPNFPIRAPALDRRRHCCSVDDFYAGERRTSDCDEWSNCQCPSCSRKHSTEKQTHRRDQVQNSRGQSRNVISRQNSDRPPQKNEQPAEVKQTSAQPLRRESTKQLRQPSPSQLSQVSSTEQGAVLDEAESRQSALEVEVEKEVTDIKSQ